MEISSLNLVEELLMKYGMVRWVRRRGPRQRCVVDVSNTSPITLTLIPTPNTNPYAFYYLLH